VRPPGRRLRVSIHPPLRRRGELLADRVPVERGRVSIHPPLRRRGEPSTVARAAGRSGFNPPPTSSARGTGLIFSQPQAILFQSTPRFVGEGNLPPAILTMPSVKFQSTPRFVGEGNEYNRSMTLNYMSFNPPPASSARGTDLERGTWHGLEVSIHPPLRRRGERATAGVPSGAGVFQSTPRFVGEGNGPTPTPRS